MPDGGAVGGEEGVVGQEGAVLFDGLREEDAVEGVFVPVGQRLDRRRVARGHRQFAEARRQAFAPEREKQG